LKKFISLSKIREALPGIFEGIVACIVPFLKAVVLVCALTGFLYLADFFLNKPHEQASKREPMRGVYLNIVLDDSRLVRCRTIDRTQPSCTMISDCDDDVDRCVVTFEILHRLPGPSDFLPTEAGD
jgi:hypothetical protein